MSPLPGWGIIPPEWAEAHRSTSEATLVDTIAFYHAGEPAPWPTTPGGSGPAPFHTTKCRVQQLNREGSAESAVQQVTTHDYRVVISADGPTIVGGESGNDYAIVTESSDAKLVGRRLEVRDVLHGSLIWERDLVCVDNLTQNRTS